MKVVFLILTICLTQTFAQTPPPLKKEFLPYDPENDDYCTGWWDELGLGDNCIQQCRVAQAYARANGCSLVGGTDSHGLTITYGTNFDCTIREKNTKILEIARKCEPKPGAEIGRRGTTR